MRKGSLIDDVDMELGHPILFTNQEIRRMIDLAEPQEDDVFYDLGCGWGQNLIIVASESKVRECVGIEFDESRFLEAKRRIARWPPEVSDRIRVVKGELLDLIKNGYLEEDGQKVAELTKATIIFYGLSSLREDLRSIKKWFRMNQQGGCRLVYYCNWLIPEIMPDDMEYPFYVSRFQRREGHRTFSFREPRTSLDWLQSVIPKNKTSIPQRKKISVQELWDELSHDNNVKERGDVVDDYRKRLRAFLRQRRRKP